MNLTQGTSRTMQPGTSLRVPVRTRTAVARCWVAAAWLILAPFAPSLAGPPLETEDTGILADGEWESIVAAYREHTRAEETWGLPVLDLSVGVGHASQLSLTLPRIMVRTEPGGKRVSGLGAATLGFKRAWRSGGPWTLAVAPSLDLVVSHDVIPRHSAEDATTLHLPLVWSHAGDHWTVFGQVGWRWQRGRDSALDFGLAAERAMGADTRWLMELFGENPDGAGDWHGRLRVGLVHDIGEHLSLLGSVASEPAALHGATDRMDLGIYLALQWVATP